MLQEFSNQTSFLNQKREVKKIWIFDTTKCYEYGLRTRWIYTHPEKHYTTNTLKCVGKYTHTEEYGMFGEVIVLYGTLTELYTKHVYSEIYLAYAEIV